MKKETKTSEYGAGLFYSLFLFAKHFERWEKMRNEGYLNVNWMWFNGAGDHLLNLDVNSSVVIPSLKRRMKKIQSEVLSLRMNHEATDTHFEKIFDDIESWLLDFDKSIGVESVEAEWK